eukprot:6206254-Pleurochrysis_carterae.AAC.2
MRSLERRCDATLVQRQGPRPGEVAKWPAGSSRLKVLWWLNTPWSSPSARGPRIAPHRLPHLALGREDEPLIRAARSSNAFGLCVLELEGDKSTAQTLPTSKTSQVTFKAAPWGRKDVCERRLTRSDTSSISIVSRMLSSARASRMEHSLRSGMLAS